MRGGGGGTFREAGGPGVVCGPRSAAKDPGIKGESWQGWEELGGLYKTFGHTGHPPRGFGQGLETQREERVDT